MVMKDEHVVVNQHERNQDATRVAHRAARDAVLRRQDNAVIQAELQQLGLALRRSEWSARTCRKEMRTPDAITSQRLQLGQG